MVYQYCPKSKKGAIAISLFLYLVVFLILLFPLTGDSQALTGDSQARVKLSPKARVKPAPDTAINALSDGDGSNPPLDDDNNGGETIVTSFTGTNAPTSYQCQAVDNSGTYPWAACTSPWSKWLFDGTDTVRVRACNASGCDATPAQRTFTIQYGTASPAQCADGFDNDGDGRIDYPNDPDCTSLTDTTEAAPATLPDTAITSVKDNDGSSYPGVDDDVNGGETMVVSFTGTNTPTSYECRYTDNSGTSAWSACTSPWNVWLFVGSNNSVSVKACNAAGCDSTPASAESDVVSGSASPPLCADGTDNDADAKIDYPNDPGCSSASDNDEADSVGGGVDPSGQAMPTTVTGWTQLAADNFPYSVPLGSFPAGSGGKWGAYPDGWNNSTGTSTYNCTKVCSVHDGILDLYLHTESGAHYTAVPFLIIPGGQDRLYGRYAVRFTADAMPRYKAAWLLWPASDVWPRDGEIDFPEGDFDQSICAFMHRQNATTGGDQDAYCTTTHYQGWHTAVVEWKANDCKFYLDGVLIGHSTSRVPNTPMHWVLQTEGNLSAAPADSTQGHVYIDWAAVWSPA